MNMVTYQNYENAKSLWDNLESKYIAEDSSSKKFLVSDLFKLQNGRLKTNHGSI